MALECRDYADLDRRRDVRSRLGRLAHRGMIPPALGVGRVASAAAIALHRHVSAQRELREVVLRHSPSCSLTSSVRSHQQPSLTGGGTPANVATC